MFSYSTNKYLIKYWLGNIYCFQQPIFTVAYNQLKFAAVGKSNAMLIKCFTDFQILKFYIKVSSISSSLGETSELKYFRFCHYSNLPINLMVKTLVIKRFEPFIYLFSGFKHLKNEWTNLETLLLYLDSL